MDEKASGAQGKHFDVETQMPEREKKASRIWDESKRMWQIAAPAMLAAVAEFSIGLVTSAFVGHLGELELAAVSIVQNVLENLVYGVMLGMGSALETLCGQAVGAGQFGMLGVYMQRSWIISGVTASALTPLYIFASQLLQLLHQDKAISQLSGKYSIWVVPQLFAFSLNFPMQKFLQSQSRVWVITIITAAVLAFHVLLNWALVTKLGQGLLGAAIAGNISWWLLVFSQFVYVVSGTFADAWKGFSFAAFKSLAGFIKLSLASAIMLWLVIGILDTSTDWYLKFFIVYFCVLNHSLELWYFTVVILMVGYLKNPEIAVDSISICTNLHTWTLMIALGFNSAVSVRVANELGAGNHKEAKFSVVVTILTSMIIGVVLTAVIMASNNEFPKIFTGKPIVIRETSKLGYFLAATIFLNSILPVLHGVAVGAGWQMSVALINAGCYYIFGLPVGALLGYKLKLGVQGIWSGMLIGCLLQIVILLFIIYRTNWHKEALQAEQRIRTWGGGCPESHGQTSSEPHIND